MLYKDPNMRMGVSEALNHPWLKYHTGRTDTLEKVEKIIYPQFIEHEPKKKPKKKKHTKPQLQRKRSSFTCLPTINEKRKEKEKS
jgi:hypothetical protein